MQFCIVLTTPYSTFQFTNFRSSISEAVAIATRYSSVILWSFFTLSKEEVILVRRAWISYIKSYAEFLDKCDVMKKCDRSHCSVKGVYLCLGINYFHQAYRMSFKSFWVLHNKLKGSIELYANLVQKRKVPSDTGRLHVKYIDPQAPNRKIPSSVLLALAIQYFAGGSTYDLMVKYGVSHTEIFTSIWAVDKAVNSFVKFEI